MKRSVGSNSREKILSIGMERLSNWLSLSCPVKVPWSRTSWWVTKSITHLLTWRFLKMKLRTWKWEWLDKSQVWIQIASNQSSGSIQIQITESNSFKYNHWTTIRFSAKQAIHQLPLTTKEEEISMGKRLRASIIRHRPQMPSRRDPAARHHLSHWLQKQAIQST